MMGERHNMMGETQYMMGERHNIMGDRQHDERQTRWVTNMWRENTHRIISNIQYVGTAPIQAPLGLI